MKHRPSSVHGFLCLNKPAGLTSFVAAAKCRSLTGAAKSGHTGTLDPMATGVLTVALGAATRFIELIPSHEKSYRAVFRLGETTDTLDSTGTVLETRPVSCLAADVTAALEGFRGEILQVPPMYSALQKDGVRLYTLARQGVEIEREARPVTISKLTLAASDDAAHTYTIDVTCSAGTYIRTLIADLGEALGCGAVMTALCRTAAHGLTLGESYDFPALEAMSKNGTVNRAILPVQALLGFPRLSVSDKQAVRFSNGGALDLGRLRGLSGEGLYSVFSPAEVFLGVGLAKGEELLVKKTMPVEQSAVSGP